MTQAKAELRIYSPRWGTEDSYELSLSDEAIVISHGPRTAKCTWRENLDPEWSGHSLREMMENESVYPPAILPWLIEHAWASWRDSQLDESQLQHELDVLATWLNDFSRAKPSTDYWRGVF